MKVIGERKAVARRLAELTGEAVVYTRMPRCAYEVGHYTIGRDGNITVDEGGDLEPLRVLAREGLAVEELLPVCSDSEVKDQAVHMKEIATNYEEETRISEAIEAMKREAGSAFSLKTINLAELERRTGVQYLIFGFYRIARKPVNWALFGTRPRECRGLLRFT